MSEQVFPSSALHGANAMTASAESVDQDDKLRKIPFKPLPKFGGFDPALEPTILQLMRGEAQEIGSVALPKNKKLPAGFTYFGQFVAHDISYNPIVCGQNRPYLRLQSIYGGSPLMMPYLYAHYPDHFDDEGVASLARTTQDDYNVFRDMKFRLLKRGKKMFDVPRTADDMALMADTRNDQNFILSQLHCTCLRIHNAMLEYIFEIQPGGQPINNQAAFKQTVQEMVLTYQWLIVNKYLKKLVYAEQLIEDLKDKANFRFYNVNADPELMPEFRQAAFRIGHSQVLDAYVLNETRERRRLYDNNDGNRNAARKDLRGFKQHKDLHIDWTVFFDLDPEVTPQPSAAIDHLISDSLLQLPFLPQGRRSLPAINIDRSRNLPTGHSLAKALYESFSSIDPSLSPLTDDAVRVALGGKNWDKKYSVLKDLRVSDLPLWLYILLEAKIQCNGQSLGLLGSHIIAEQMMWILHRDPESYLARMNRTNWRPVINFDKKSGELLRTTQSPEERHIEFNGFLRFIQASNEMIRKERLK